jgi:hypothetical protein
VFLSLLPNVPLRHERPRVVFLSSQFSFKPLREGDRREQKRTAGALCPPVLCVSKSKFGWRMSHSGRKCPTFKTCPTFRGFPSFDFPRRRFLKHRATEFTEKNRCPEALWLCVSISFIDVPLLELVTFRGLPSFLPATDGNGEQVRISLASLLARTHWNQPKSAPVPISSANRAREIEPFASLHTASASGVICLVPRFDYHLVLNHGIASPQEFARKNRMSPFRATTPGAHVFPRKVFIVQQPDPSESGQGQPMC